MSSRSFRSVSLVAWTLILISLPSFSKMNEDLLELSPGGQGSTQNLTSDAFSLPAKNITKVHRKDFAVGRSIFRQNWVTAPASVVTLQGLGPTFNAASCVACHTNDGRGRPPLSSKEEIVGLLFRLSVPGEGSHGEPKPVAHYGDQLNPHAILDVLPEGSVSITTTEIKGEYPDGQKFTLSQPAYKFEKMNYGDLPEDVMISPRTAPAMIGLGLLEAIPEKDILRQADPDDKDQDGIAGKPNYVWDFSKKKKVLGRFGWKANQPSVFQQNAGALSGDMGITSPLFPHQPCPESQAACAKAFDVGHPEISMQDLMRLTTYAKTLSVPKRRELPPEEISRGRTLLQEASCVKCHTPHFRTGLDPEFPENSYQDIFPYSDLLLHDMGEALADHRPDFQASGRQWRTQPLWGMGLTQKVNGHTRFLHDGRARNVEEAILWHGGEAEKSKKSFMSLSSEDRHLLIRYVESL